MSPETGLRVEDMVVRFGGNTALDGVDLVARAGEVTAVIGPNGAGKSTLLKCIAGLQRPTGGRIVLDGRDVTSRSFHRRCNDGLAATFQTPLGNDRLSVEEQLVVQQRRVKHVRLVRRSALAPVEEVLDGFGLRAVARRRLSELTLGEVRRFELARALVARPSLLLVDEPSSGMSGEESRLLASELVRVAAQGVVVVLVEHNIPFVRATATHAVAIDTGRVISHGDVASVLASDEVREAYLGTTAA